MATDSYSDLESLCGELLPPRIVLSVVDISYVRNTYTTNEFPASGNAASSGGGAAASAGHGQSVAYACSSNASPQSNSGLLGLFAAPGANTMTCMPAAVSGS